MKLKFIGAAHEVTGSCTLLEDCGKHILIDCGMEQGAEWHNRKAARSGDDVFEPIYTLADCDKALKQFVGYGYNEPVEIFEGIKVEFIDAGHLLGSALPTLTKKIGDRY